MEVHSNLLIPGSRQLPITLDLAFVRDSEKKPLVIFCHGFKGFKDWGHFNYLMKRFAGEGFIFLKFNFSHNGVTGADLLNITDMEAFGNNNYSTELNDLGLVIDWALETDLLKGERENSIFLIGHSRGGGISILKAGEDKRVKKLCTWASVSDLLNRNKKKTIETWKSDGVVYATNTRTGQKLPMYYQFYEDLLKNKDRLNVHQAAKSLKIPFLIVHGTGDEAVDAQEAEQLRRSAAHAQLMLVDGAGHTFGVKHPFDDQGLPGDAELVVFNTIVFLKSA